MLMIDDGIKGGKMFERLFALIEAKHKLDEHNPWYHGAQTYLDSLTEEIAEVRAELKENNSVYLEDELGDVLWTLFHLVKSLEQEGKVQSLEHIIQRAEKKYRERLAVITHASADEKTQCWQAVKARQKQVLAEEHAEKTAKGNSQYETHIG